MDHNFPDYGKDINISILKYNRIEVPKLLRRHFSIVKILINNLTFTLNKVGKLRKSNLSKLLKDLNISIIIFKSLK